MPIIRKIIILDRLKEIENSLDLITNNIPENYGDFKNMGLIKDDIMKREEFIIQNIIDICAIISSDMKLEKPYSEYDIIDNLKKSGILSEDLSSKIKEMKSLRNILLHRYGKINDELVYKSLINNLEDVEQFVKNIKILLNKN